MSSRALKPGWRKPMEYRKMNKQELHDEISATTNQTIITVDDFISVYGNDNVKNVGKNKITRADVLAERYNLSVSKQGTDYIFIRES